ncbi:dna methyltransferase 1 associated protein 1 [Lichtheimia corymbifera JMRC:FSU:9682]|uniref:SWR1-complex protein 4 n=1 Tax=Lichtheimia corymbifera JMRC:FSU:9682 TaxID=1263082 RepID=A0A068S3F7_9FUNG|nr:dna methyltransferase 1 associated protein 1 [Lichtheimia corymbifera JMRC:FSU:9682]
MSGSDIRDILQLGKPSESSGIKKAKQPTERRPDGISRELYSLIGNAPSVALLKPTYKAKFNVKKKATPWMLESFSNNARSDNLTLQHWIKAANANKSTYPFAYTEKPSAVIEYTDEEYEKYLADIDPEWSKEETDYLMDLCRKYNMRFIIITDRYSYTEKSRSMEDLKDRYYAICRTLAKERASERDTGYPLYQYAFDKAREVERKQALETLAGRTKEQMDEEEALLVEMRRIEQNEARLEREKESVMHLLAQLPASSRGDTNNTAANNSSPEHSKKRRRSGIDDQTKKSRRSSSIAEASTLPKEKLVPGVHVQSQRLPSTKGAMHAKVLKVMDELGVGPRPVMPTAAVCHGFEQLQTSIATMFELKKVVDKMEIEHKIASHIEKLHNQET